MRYEKLKKLMDEDPLLKAIFDHRVAYLEWLASQLPGAGRRGRDGTRGFDIKPIDIAQDKE